jgi:hypothetical protein
MSEGSRRRLDYAQRLLDGDPDDGGSADGVWARSVVWLTRLAIERELDAFWARRSPTGMSHTRRSQLLALGVVVEGDTPYRVTELWNTLSRAAHHHHYELAPTAAELRGWLSEARLLCADLANLT